MIKQIKDLQHSPVSLLFLALGAVSYILAYPVAFGPNAWSIQKITPLLIVFYPVPLLIHANEKSRRIFLKAWLYYFFALMGILYWLTISMKNYGNLSTPVSLTGLTATCLFRSFFPALMIWIWSKFKHLRLNFLFGAVLLTLQEGLFHFFPFGGFAWISAGYSLTPDLLWIQMADLIGIHGLNFSVYLISFLIVRLFHHEKKMRGHSLKILLLLLFAFHIYGLVRLQTLNNTVKAKGLNIGWVQSNIAQTDKWNRSKRKEIIQKHQSLTLKLSRQNPDLIIWPEAAIPQSFSQNLKLLPPASVEGNTSKILLGAPSFEFKNQKKTHYNSAFLVGSDGVIEQRYDKRHLVPFGEFIPSLGIGLDKRLPVLAGMFTPGKDLRPMKIGTHLFGVSICYESLYPQLFRQLKDKGATFFVNITNDAWFDSSSGPFQHLRFSTIRAIENRMHIIRVSNTGISALFNPTGRLKFQTELFQDNIQMVHIKPQNKKTIYATFPYGIHIILMIMLGFIFLTGKISNR